MLTGCGSDSSRIVPASATPNLKQREPTRGAPDCAGRRKYKVRRRDGDDRDNLMFLAESERKSGAPSFWWGGGVFHDCQQVKRGDFSPRPQKLSGKPLSPMSVVQEHRCRRKTDGMRGRHWPAFDHRCAAPSQSFQLSVAFVDAPKQNNDGHAAVNLKGYKCTTHHVPDVL